MNKFKLFNSKKNMDDEFELVSKAELKKLRENNSKDNANNSKNNENKLKDSNNTSESKNQEKTQISKEVLEQFREIIKQEQKLDRENLIQDLTHLKDLNKTTLSSVLERTDKLDTRIETLVNAISDLVKTVHELVEENSKETQVDNSEIISKIESLKTNSKSEQSHKQIETKLEEIDEFMKNLKLLLSQIKPSDMNM